MKVVFWLIQGNITNWIQTFRQFTQEMYNLSSVFHALLRSTTWTHEALLRVNIFSVWVWIVANASSFVFFVCTHTECVSVGLHTCASWPRWEHRGGNGRKKAALSEACNVLGFGIYIGKNTKGNIYCQAHEGFGKCFVGGLFKTWMWAFAHS